MTTNDTRPLSERLAEIADLPSIGINLTLERRTAIAEAVEMAKQVEVAPVAIMDTRGALGICAPTEDDFPALYALQGKRVALVEIPND